MNTEIKAVHFTMNEDARAYLLKKVERIHNAENMIVDLNFTITQDAGNFTAAADVNLRWGAKVHVDAKNSMLTTSLDMMIDKLEQKITKEKEKVKEKR